MPECMFKRYEHWSGRVQLYLGLARSREQHAFVVLRPHNNAELKPLRVDLWKDDLGWWLRLTSTQWRPETAALCTAMFVGDHTWTMYQLLHRMVQAASQFGYYDINAGNHCAKLTLEMILLAATEGPCDGVDATTFVNVCHGYVFRTDGGKKLFNNTDKSMP